MLKSISFDDFSRETFADIFLVGCLFMQTKCANRWDYKRGFISDLRSSIKYSYYVFLVIFFSHFVKLEINHPIVATPRMVSV